MIAIITDDPGWHGKQLLQCFIERGLDAKFVRLQDCHFDLTGATASLQIQGFTELPCAVFVRGIPGGSLEQVVYYLDVLHAMEALGIRVMNNVRCIERSVDKGMTSFILKQHQINTPKTIYSSDYHFIYRKLREGLQAGSDFVLKPVFGSQGKGLQKISDVSQLVDLSPMHGVVYLQEFIDSGCAHGVDFRVFVIAGQVLASMKRVGDSWITNVAQGGSVEAIDIGAEAEQMAIKSAHALDMDYAGVDLIRDKQGVFWVTEVNSVPAWKGLQGTTQVQIADAICAHFIAQSGLSL